MLIADEDCRLYINDAILNDEITRELAIKFIQDNIKKDEWLEEYYPQQMQILHAALAQTREQVIQQLKQTYT